MKLEINFKDRKGEILIEAAVAISVIVVGVFGTLTFLSRSISLNKLVTNQYVANYLAAEQIEVAKNIIDVQGWDSTQEESFVDYNSTSFEFFEEIDPEVKGEKYKKILFNNDDTSKNYSSSEGGETPFLKRLEIKKDMDGERIIVKSYISWQEKGIDFNVDLEDQFYKWH